MVIMVFHHWAVVTAIVLIAFATMIEGSAAVFARYALGPPQLTSLIWNPDFEKARESWNTQSSQIDEEIGGFRTGLPRLNPEFSDGTRPCGSAYGASLVYGWEVTDGKGWVEQLSHLLNCRVANYAVNNSSIGEDYMHFRKSFDDSPFVLLGIAPDSIMDNILQYDGFFDNAMTGPFGLRGRFLLDKSDELKWLAPPELNLNSFLAMLRRPAEILPHSYFLPDTPDGPVSARFPYTLTLARAALVPRLHSILEGRPEWSNFYTLEHPSRALPLMTAIIKAFVELGATRGKRSLVVMLPLAASFRVQAKSGSFEYAPLVEDLAANNIETFDAGPPMVEALKGRSPCEFFRHVHAGARAWLTSPVPCGGHYNSFAHTILARLVASELRRRDFLPK